MKLKNIFFTALCLPLVLLAGCVKDDGAADGTLAGVRIAATVEGTAVQTRTTGDTWETGDGIGVFMLSPGGDIPSGILTVNGAAADNRLYSWNGGQFVPDGAGQTIYHPQSGTADFAAYYPHKAGLTGYIYPVDVSDQSDPGAIDLLYSDNATGLARGDVVAMTFSHRLSKLTLHVKKGEGMTGADFTNLSATLKGLPATADFSLTDAAFSNAGTPVDFGALKTATAQDDDATFEAILIPQPDGAAGRKVVFAVGGESYAWTIPDGTAAPFVSGRNHPWTITISRSGITATAGDITPWTGTADTPTQGQTTPPIIASGDAGPLTWTLFGDGTLTISGSGAMSDYSIPWSSHVASIEKVVIGSGVTSIGNNAFRGCSNLASITIPESVGSIGSDAFTDCTGLTSVTFSGGVGSIGVSAFSNCTGLTSVTIPESVWSIGDSAFLGCTGLTSVTIPDGVSIGNLAFRSCTGLTSVTIPDGVSIGNLAFRSCTGLTSVTFSGGVGSIGDSAFSNCTGLTSVTILAVVPPTLGIQNFEADGDTLYVPAGCETDYQNSAWGGAFDNIVGFASGTTGSLSWMLPPDGTLTISGAGLMTDYGYDDNLPPWNDHDTGIKKVVIGNGVTRIGDNAFRGYTNLTDVTIPGSVTGIGDNAFRGCTYLESVTIPDGVTSIEGSAFEGCTRLASIIIPGEVTSIGDGAFQGSGLTSVTIPGKVTGIGNQTFMNCTDLTSVTILQGVGSIGASAFSGCTKLAGVTIPESVTGIGASAFSGCTDLTSITIPGEVTGIGNQTFMNCTDLTSVTILQGVGSIGASAFSGCTKLAGVTIPESVTGIGYEAFSGCTGLASVTVLAADPPRLDGTLNFSSVSGDTLYVLATSVDAYKGNAAWNTAFSGNIVAIPAP